MRSKIVLEVETSEMKEFLPEEGKEAKDFTKEEIEFSTKKVEKLWHNAIRMSLKHLVESDSEYHKKFMDLLEEMAFDDGEMPEVEYFNEVGKLKLRVED